ncbi:SDR family oxidoreductase [Nocardioides speluncae]|uniref:SDR family oxidoreductase n=1 Tax=Nocardioides speluncae TaxID=2670337 RepID=UPI000D697677|nr:SDR family oxidoreductase [Nocardioides speluncae]
MPRTALITGASRRIGAHLAETLAAAGYRLHLHTGHDANALQDLARRLRRTHHTEVTAHVVDLSAPDRVACWVKRLRDAPNRPHLVVNNASAFPPASRLTTVEETIRILTLHVVAPIALTTTLDHHHGDHVVNVIDARVDLFSGERPAYELAKRLLRDYTLAAARQLAPRIRVNALAPGLVLPALGDDRGDGVDHLASLARDRAPLARPACVDELGAALLFLDRALSVTGQIVYVDSGEHLGHPCRRDVNEEVDVSPIP